MQLSGDDSGTSIRNALAAFGAQMSDFPRQNAKPRARQDGEE
jgi:hypothetical protein